MVGGATVEPKVDANINYKTLSKKAHAKICNSITLTQKKHVVITRAKRIYNNFLRPSWNFLIMFSVFLLSNLIETLEKV